MTSALTPGMDPTVLDLVRRQTYGASPDLAALNFNNLFGPLSNVAGGIDAGTLGGGSPANNASAPATPQSAAVGNAIGAIISNLIMSTTVGPIGAAAIGYAAHTPSTLSALQSIVSVHDMVDTTSNDDEADPNGNVSSETADPSSSNPDGTDGSSADNGTGDGTSSGDASAGDSGDSGGSTSAGDSGGSAGGDSAGGGAGSYYTGGFIPGPDVGHDTVQANLAGGEFVVPSDIVQMLGHNFFEKLLLTSSPLQDAAEKEAATAAKMKASA